MQQFLSPARARLARARLVASSYSQPLPRDNIDAATAENIRREMASYRSRTAMRGAPSSCQIPLDNNPAEPHMADALSSLFASGKYSDLVIKCGGHRWNVHRVVVCMQSRPIAAALDGGFIEASTGEFILEEDDPAIVQLLLKFMYTGFLDIELQMAPVIATPEARSSFPQSVDLSPIYLNPYQSYLYSNPGYTNSAVVTYNNLAAASYAGSFAPFNAPTLLQQSFMARPTTTTWPVPGASNAQDPPPSEPSTKPAPPPENNSKHLAKGLITSAQVYILADKYDVSPLKAMACKIYKHLSKSFWNTEEFIESLTIIFDNTPDTTTEIDMLRATASKEAMTYAKDLLTIDSFQELCQERGDIATAVLMASVASVNDAIGKHEDYCQNLDCNPGAFFG